MARRPVGFDLDMTLIDDRPATMAAFEELMAATGAVIDLSAVDSRLGTKLEDELAYWFRAEDVARAASIFRAHYTRLAADATAVLPGAVTALEAVRASGAECVIVTAKHEVSVAACVSATGLRAERVFTFVHG